MWKNMQSNLIDYYLITIYYDIEFKVNLNSFTFWVLQYSGCVEVLDRGKKGEKSYRNKIKETLKKHWKSMGIKDEDNNLECK